MNSNIEKHKKALLEELARLKIELMEIAGQDEDNPEDWRAKVVEKSINQADPLEVADEIEDMIENNAITEELQDRFNDIKRALAKIEEGTYGIDEVDGEPIPEERLAVNPAARTKVENADKLEE